MNPTTGPLAIILVTFKAERAFRLALKRAAKQRTKNTGEVWTASRILREDVLARSVDVRLIYRDLTNGRGRYKNNGGSR